MRQLLRSAEPVKSKIPFHKFRAGSKLNLAKWSAHFGYRADQGANDRSSDVSMTGAVLENK